MSEDKSERIIIPMSASLVRRIDDHRFDKRIASRAEAVRQLLEKALNAK